MIDTTDELNVAPAFLHIKAVDSGGPLFQSPIIANDHKLTLQGVWWS